MFSKHIYSDRWLPYTIAIAIVVTVYVWGQIEIYSLEEEQQTIAQEMMYNDQIRIAHTVHAKEKNESIVIPSDWKTYRNEKYGFEIITPASLENRIFENNISPALHSFGGVERQGFNVGEAILIIADKKDRSIIESGIPERCNPQNIINNHTSILLFVCEAEGGVSYYALAEGRHYLAFFDGSNSDYSYSKENIRAVLSTFKFIDNEVINKPYLACGCGCCASTSQIEERCLYHSKGDSIERIQAEDEKARSAPICSLVGCSVGVRYKYCD